MRSAFYIALLGVILCTIALVVRSGMLMRKNPGEPINAAMRRALAGVAYQWPEADAARLAQRFPGAIETPNGARYIVTQAGTGAATPKKGQGVAIHYTARFLANDEKIDASADHGGPYNFVIGQPNILPGWTDALDRMQVGEKRLVALPYWLAYGEKGQRGKIPGKAALLLEIELVAINPAPVAPASPGGS
ncbi:FKBP-type peptidyl-prolyl cis-trans isomerase [bacterium]|jgi:FKBP-type peptidyl-prolyl cis-trans isomerase|nr:FKBP-type peptidyl-prolyl cis-trans isomerase [bacterium]